MAAQHLDGARPAGSEADRLSPGRYQVTVGIEDLKIVNVEERRDCEHSWRFAAIPGRSNSLTLSHMPVGSWPLTNQYTIQRTAMESLRSHHLRAVRQACLLNILAMARVTPTKANHLLAHVTDVFFAAPSLLQRLVRLSNGPRKKFHREGPPTGGVHAALLFRIEDDRRVWPGTPSLQTVVAYPMEGVTAGRHYADLDLDLGNPLQDVVAFLIHVGELLNPGRTDHFKLVTKRKQGKAGEFLGCRIAK